MNSAENNTLCIIGWVLKKKTIQNYATATPDGNKMNQLIISVTEMDQTEANCYQYKDYY